jgi:TRAP-type uncharacterized transport system substrate-binding protein
MESAPPARRWQPRLALLAAGPPLVGLMLLLVAALLLLAWRVLDPLPARRLQLATGPDQGAYFEFAKRYLPLLRAQGLTVTLRASEGSADNLALLADPASGVQAAFVQGGVDGAAASADLGSSGVPPLVSLGSVAYEPLWLFYREDSARRLLRDKPPERLAQLAGWRINTGPEGGGSAPLFRRLAEANQLPPAQLKLGDEAAVNGVVELVQGRIDALAMVSAAEAPLVQYLLHTPGVRLFNFAQSEAYARRFPFLHPLVLPRGVVDLAADQPPQDVHLVATTASLLVRADLHPALQQLLVQTARQVHGEAGWFARGGEFPNPGTTAWPLAAEAERFYSGGPPWLQRYVPFWLASFFDRMWIVLLPLLAALLPLSRVLPPLVTLRLRSRVFRWYADLRAVEKAIDGPAADAQALRAELDRIDAQLDLVGVPLAYTNELYELRSHVQLVRRRLSVQATASVPRT